MSGTAATLETSDYVLSVKYPTEANGQATAKAKENLSTLVKQLTSARFYTQSRPGENGTLLVFVKVDDSALFKQLKSSILKKYLYGLTSEIEDDDQIINNLSETEKLNAVNALLTYPASEGGIGITPGTGSWEFVDTITPIYDYKATENLFWKLVKKPLIGEADIQTIKELAGEEVALYFGFVRFYFLWLGIPTVLGLICKPLFGDFSLVFTVLNSLWAIAFINAWKKKEQIYAAAWETKGSSKVEVKRAEFRGESEDIDLITGARTPHYPAEKRTLKKILFIPVAIFGGSLLLSYQLFCFAVEISLTEIYQGAGRAVLGLVPTVLIVGGTPFFTAFYKKFIDRAVEDENHETQSSYKSSVTQKLYVHNFLEAYAPLFITIFLYLPYGHILNNYLPFIQSFASKLNVPVVKEKYQISTGRLSTQFGFFSLISLIIGFGLENVVPITIRLLKERFIKSKAGSKDAPEEAEFLKNVRKQVALPKFNVGAEYKELVQNFGYLVIFGPVSSPAILYSFISAYVEVKGDLEKLLLGSQRPIPVPAESIDPWNTNLKILTWVGTFITPMVSILFREQGKYLESSSYNPLVSAIHVPFWKAAGIALVYENVFILFNVIVKSVFKASSSKAERDDELKVLNLRRSYINAYSKETSLTKSDIVIDPTTSSWKKFTGEQVFKQAAEISPATDDTTPIAAATTSGASIHNDSSLQHRSAKSSPSESTTASKTVPKTDAPVEPTDTPIIQTGSAASLKSGVPGNAAAAVPSAIAATSATGDSDKISREQSVSSTSLNGATLPPNFKSKKNLSETSIEKVVPATTSPTSAGQETGYTGVAGADAFGPQPVEAIENAKATQAASSSSGTSDQSKPEKPVQTEEAAAPAAAVGSADVGREQDAVPVATAAPVDVGPEQGSGSRTTREESFSSDSVSSTPGKSKNKLFSTIKKKAKNASHSLHLPTTPSK
jgi:hypothetical protein